MNSLNPLYVIINKINEHIEKSNENEYLVLFPLMKVKTQKKYEKCWAKSEILIDQRLIAQTILMNFTWKSNLI